MTQAMPWGRDVAVGMGKHKNKDTLNLDFETRWSL
jgi:hypothetical protein